MDDKVNGKRKIDTVLDEQYFDINCKKSQSVEPNDQLCSINDIYHSNECIELLQHAFQNDQSFVSEIIDDLTVNCKPFKHVILPNFIESSSFLDKLKNELLNNVEYDQKNNDLYTFRQSKDFKHIDLHCIKELRQCLINQVLPLLQFITGFELFEDEIDLTASQYRNNDVLLCHDDQLEQRRIAFILYLVDEWDKSFGGTLDFYDVDGNILYCK
jgi:2-oxoglutarate and iron-dependent oxygenase domain-containing protein 1